MGYPSLLGPILKRSAISATVTATGSSAVFQLGLGDAYALELQIGAVSGTSPTLDVVLQTSFDNGTNYQNLPLRWTQKTAATTEEWLVFRCGIGNNEVALAQVAAATGGQLAKNCIFNPQYMRLGYTAGGTTPSFVVSLHSAVIPRGAAER